MIPLVFCGTEFRDPRWRLRKRHREHEHYTWLQGVNGPFMELAMCPGYDPCRDTAGPA